MKTPCSIRFIPLALTLLWLTGCDAGGALVAPETPEPVELTYETLSTENLSLTAPGLFIFTNASPWESFWNAHRLSAKHAAPSVEFERQMIIGVVGPVQSLCATTAALIDSVWLVEGAIEIVLSVPKPVGMASKSTDCTQQRHPVEFIVIDHARRPVSFVHARSVSHLPEQARETELSLDVS